jgi:hypothetical protein
LFTEENLLENGKEQQNNIEKCGQGSTKGNVDFDNMKGLVEERKYQSLKETPPGNVSKQQSDGKINQNTFNEEDNKISGDIYNENMKEFPEKGDFHIQSLPPKDASKPSTQISKLLNFVNSVTMPLLKFRAGKRTLSSHEDVNNNSLLKNSYEESLVGQKRSAENDLSSGKRLKYMNQSNETSKSMDQSNHMLKSSMDQSNHMLKSMDQSHHMLKSMDHLKEIVKSIDQSKNRSIPTDQSNKMLKSLNQHNERLKSRNPYLTLPQNIEKESCTEKRSSQLESDVTLGKRTDNEETEPENISTKEIRKIYEGVGVSCQDIVKRSSARSHSETASTSDSIRTHPQNSLYCAERLQKIPEGQQRASTSQWSKSLDGYRSPSCGETDNGRRHEVPAGQSNTPVGSVASRKFPVVLNAYSIHPSQFSNQQIIYINDESKDTPSNENNIPRREVRVYPEDNFCFQQKQAKQIVERFSNTIEPRKYRKLEPTKQDAERVSNTNGMLEEKESELQRLDSQQIRSVFQKITSKSSFPGNYHPPCAQEYIDLNRSTSTDCTNYHTNHPRQELVQHSYYGNKEVPLQVLYTFETKVSLSRAPDPRMPEIYNPTRTTFSGFASRLICSTLPIVTEHFTGYSVNDTKNRQTHRQR